MSNTCCAKAEDTLIFACAGGSNVGQITNAAAVELHERGLGRLYCLAGVAADIDGMVQKAQAAARTIALDGCPVACARHGLEQAGVQPTSHLVVTELGLEKGPLSQWSADDAARVVAAVLEGAPASQAASAPAAQAENAPAADCCACTAQEVKTVKLTVYGPGCPKCKQTEEIAREAAAQAGVEAEFEKVTNVIEIAKAGVLFTPALAVNGKVVVKGKVPSVAEVVGLITSAQAEQ